MRAPDTELVEAHEAAGLRQRGLAELSLQLLVPRRRVPHLRWPPRVDVLVRLARLRLTQRVADERRGVRKLRRAQPVVVVVVLKASLR